ncbi:MAG: sulfotransferase family protein [Planctomycetota bacterium]|jgi:hypothetical protein
MSDAPDNPFVFVVGCPRSGTTLLQRMLDNHPQLAVANDTHFIGRVLKDPPPGTNPPLTPELLEQVRTYRRFRRLGLSDDAVERAAAGAHDYRSLVVGLYDEFARQQGKAYGGEKTPDYVRCLPFLHDLCPWAKSIHIIRDGRDVALSTLEWATPEKGPGRLELWREQPVATCALWWCWQVGTGRRDGAAVGSSRYHEVLYEQLVDQPEPALRVLTDFLQLPYSEQMVQFHVGKERDDPGLSAKKAWRPATAGLRSWRNDMPAADVELFEALAGDLLEALGYERASSDVSSATAAIAERCRSWWQANKGPIPAVDR